MRCLGPVCGLRASVGRSDMSPACLLHVSYVRLWTHAGADFQTFRREDSAHHNSHLRALDSSQQLGERHDRFKTPGDEPDKNRLTVAQARTHATLTRSHARTTSPRPRCQPSGRLGLEDTGRRRDTISSAPRSLRTHDCAGSRIAMPLFLPSRCRQNALLSRLARRRIRSPALKALRCPPLQPVLVLSYR